MPCTLTIHPDGAFIEAAYSGVVSFNDLMHSRKSILTMARAQRLHRLYVDKRQVSGGHSIGDLFLLVNWLVLQQDAAGMREAVIRPDGPSMQQCCEFWETACTNLGLSVRLFDDKAPAIAWLVAENPATH